MLKRAPFVVAGTIAGLVGLFSFRSTPASLGLNAVASSSPGSGASSNAAAGTGGTSTGGTATLASPASAAGSGTRSATGPLVNYYFGVLSVSVTATGTKLDKVTIGSIQDGGNPLSASIDGMAIPQLESQALAVQGAGIQGVSGASYTSAGFKMSLQGALSKLGIK